MLAYLTGTASKDEKTINQQTAAKPDIIKKKPVNKPLPGTPPTIQNERPGTSGTELGLRTKRQEAGSAYQQAAKAEQEYRARRQAIIARENGKAAQLHLSEAGKQFAAGITALTTAVRLMPSVYREKRARSRVKKEKALAAREKAKAEKLEHGAREKAERDAREREKEEEVLSAGEGEEGAGEGVVEGGLTPGPGPVPGKVDSVVVS